MERRFNPSKDELAELYKLNSCAEIGKVFGVNAETVRKRLHEHGLNAMRSGGRRRFFPDEAELRELYQSMSMRQIADKYGVGETVVFKRIKEYGIELKDHINHRLKPGRVFSEEHRNNLKNAHIARQAYGEKNPNWRGGRSEENRIARSNWQYRDWKKASLEKAGYKCQECGVQQGHVCDCCGVKTNLHVHHVKSFAKFHELRYDVDNSEVLCPRCHMKHHGAR